MGKLFASLFAAGMLAVTVSAAESNGTQTFTPARFALLSAPVLVQTMTNQAQMLNQQAMFRIDTQTGQVWMLQVVVQSDVSPLIVNAVWVPVTEIQQQRLQWQNSIFQQMNQPWTSYQNNMINTD